MKKNGATKRLTLILAVLLMIGFPGGKVYSESEVKLSKGQTVYIAAYPSVYINERGAEFQLTVTLSIRNTDPAHGITITSIKYYDPTGALVKDYLEAPKKLPSLASIRFLAERTKSKGDSCGPSFIVKWRSEDKEVNRPIIESIMIGTASTQGISFGSPGRVINDTTE
jgi:hypothetical protein